MSEDDRRPPRKTVPWWQIATLVVTVARFALPARLLRRRLG